MAKEYGKKYGRNKMADVIRLYDSRYEPDFYQRKNEDYNLAMAFSGGYDMPETPLVRENSNIWHIAFVSEVPMA